MGEGMVGKVQARQFFTRPDRVGREADLAFGLLSQRFLARQRIFNPSQLELHLLHLSPCSLGHVLFDPSRHTFSIVRLRPPRKKERWGHARGDRGTGTPRQSSLPIGAANLAQPLCSGGWGSVRRINSTEYKKRCEGREFGGVARPVVVPWPRHPGNPANSSREYPGSRKRGVENGDRIPV